MTTIWDHDRQPGGLALLVRPVLGPERVAAGQPEVMAGAHRLGHLVPRRSPDVVRRPGREGPGERTRRP
ncbi:hypothetical protein [Streptomyces marokkonensis]|uniref:hypothetical protein n=1 Tax=Streptomyces marokkonensis TaxID=324855 RepID=UPI0031EDA7BA